MAQTFDVCGFIHHSTSLGIAIFRRPPETAPERTDNSLPQPAVRLAQGMTFDVAHDPTTSCPFCVTGPKRQVSMWAASARQWLRPASRGMVGHPEGHQVVTRSLSPLLDRLFDPALQQAYFFTSRHPRKSLLVLSPVSYPNRTCFLFDAFLQKEGRS